jgi:hypothetical protein
LARVIVLLKVMYFRTSYFSATRAQYAFISAPAA